jgi:hypothetical protein
MAQAPPVAPPPVKPLQYANKNQVPRRLKPDRPVPLPRRQPSPKLTDATTRIPKILGKDGRRHFYLNAAMPSPRRGIGGVELPKDDQPPLSATVCAGPCSHGYAQLHNEHCGQPCCDEGRACDECRIEAAEEKRARLQEEWGIDLGAAGRDPRNERDAYRYTPPRRTSMRMRA